MPDGEAGWVAVPVVVDLGDVADIVEFLGGVVLMDVFSIAGEVIAAVFDSPEPVVVSMFIKGSRGKTNMLFPSKVTPTSFRIP